jgi:nitroimidazol reductase NimA-like FMN-containing flavoprotein (pyridoxamine 5'-phosphate oxidase superfamily)
MDAEAHLESMELEECLVLLRNHSVGRIAVVVNEAPVVLPVNYRMVETLGLTWVALRTRPHNVLDRPWSMVAFEIDDIDPGHRQGWSVLVRGTLEPVDPDAADFRDRFDSAPWLATERDAWLMIEPFSITGRRLLPSEREWAFHVRAYL